VALGVYPHFVVDRTEGATTAAIEAARGVQEQVASR
jgi:hypothetical protein